MGRFRIVENLSWPRLTGYERLEKMDWAESDALSYFSAWDRPWGEDVTQSSWIWKTDSSLDLSKLGVGKLSLSYVVIVTLSTDDPDIGATNKYIEHKERLLYPIPIKSSLRGRARFLGATIGQGKTKLVFLISDPEIDRILDEKEKRDEFGRLLN